MKFQLFFNFNGHGISLDLYGFIISGSRLQSSLEIQEPWFWGMSLSRSTQHILLKQVILEFIHVFGICRGDSSWIPMRSHETMWTMGSAWQCERWSLEMRCDILEGVSSNVSCGSQAKRLWSMPTWWWAKPLGFAGGAQSTAVSQWHSIGYSRWECIVGGNV